MACVVLLLLPQGGPPLLTDDTGTPGRGKWEINLAATLESRGRSGRFEAPLLDINYGLGDRIQLKCELPWVVLDEEGESTVNGAGNALLGVKWRFLDEKKGGVSVSIYPQLELNTLDSSPDRGLVERGSELLLPVQLQKDLGIFEVDVELGYAIREGREDEWDFGVAVGRAMSDRFELIAEIHGRGNVCFDEADLLFHVGFRAKLSDLNTLLFAVGRGLAAPSEREHALSVYVGLQFNF